MNPYQWALARLISNGNITGLARLQAEAAHTRIRTVEGFTVLLAALGFTDRGICEWVQMAHARASEADQ